MIHPSQCHHEPECQFKCIKCGLDLPEYKDFNEMESSKKRPFIVHFENGTRHFIKARSEEESIDIAVVGLCRSAGLCKDHLVRIVKVTEL